MDLCFISYLVNTFELIFVYTMRLSSSFSFFACRCSIALVPFVGNTIFLSLVLLHFCQKTDIFVRHREKKSDIFVWICFWVVCSVPLICLFLCQYNSFDYVIHVLKLGTLIPFTLYLLSKEY